METNIILANIIFVFHIIIILFILIAPFTNKIALLILHIVFSLCLLLHWHLNSNVCSLSILESHLRGLDYTNTFSHQFISPIYNISSTIWNDFTTIITLILMYISIIQLINNNIFYKIIDTCTENNKTVVSKLLCLQKLLIL